MLDIKLFFKFLFLSVVRMNSTDEQGFRCPKKECHKLFRKENLLMVSFFKLYCLL